MTFPFPIPQALLAAAGIGDDELVFIAEAYGAGNDTVDVPVEVIDGDILIMLCQSWGSGADPADATPTGWTKITTQPGSGFFLRNSFFFRVGLTSMAGTTIATLPGQGTEVDESYTILGVFRCGRPRVAITAFDVGSQITDSDPTAQVVNVSTLAAAVPVIVLGAYSSSTSISPRTFSPAEDGELEGDPGMLWKYKLYDGDATKVDHTIDMDDEDVENCLFSAFLECGSDEVFAKTGSFNTGTAVATTQIPITGLGFRPKAILFFWSGRADTTDAAGGANVAAGIGFATGTANRHAVCARRADASAGSTAFSYAHNAGCMCAPNAAASLEGYLDVLSLDVDGFTLIVDDQLVVDRRVHYLAIGGAGVSASAVMWNPASSPQSVTTAGLQPTAVMFHSILSGGTAPPAAGGDPYFVFGIAASPSQQWSERHFMSGAAPTAPSYSQRTNQCLHSSTGTVEAALSGFLSNGFQLTWTGSPTSSLEHFYMALNGMATAAGSFDTRTDGADITVTGLGFVPKGIVFKSLGANTLGINTAGTVCWSMGVATSPSDQRAQAYSQVTGTSPAQMATAIEHDSVYISLNASDAVDGIMALKSIDADGFTCYMTTPDSGATLVKWFAFGDIPDEIGGLGTYYSLLLHCRYDESPTDFHDSSDYYHAVTVNGNAVIDELTPGPTTKFKGSALLDGTGDWLEVADHASLDFGTGDFTVDFWVRMTATTIAMGLIHKGLAATGTAAWAIMQGSASQIQYRDGAASVSITSSVSITTGVWYHVAATRASGTVRLFINGLLQGSVVDSANKDNSEPLRIGQNPASTFTLNGNMTEIRILKGTALWTSSFAPPLAPYIIEY